MKLPEEVPEWQFWLPTALSEAGLGAGMVSWVLGICRSNLRIQSSLEPFLIASQSLLVLLHQTNGVAHSNMPSGYCEVSSAL